MIDVVFGGERDFIGWRMVHEVWLIVEQGLRGTVQQTIANISLEVNVFNYYIKC
jgi:hypothetical protein